MSATNEKRNREMVRLKFASAKKYSYSDLGTMFGVTKELAFKIVKRDWTKYLSEAQLAKKPTYKDA